MKRDLPIRTKLEMAENIGKVLRHLFDGDRMRATPLLDALKISSIYLDDDIQQDVLAFVQQVLFQFDYDPGHKLTPEIQKAADKLIEDMGFKAP